MKVYFIKKITTTYSGCESETMDFAFSSCAKAEKFIEIIEEGSYITYEIVAVEVY